MFYPATPTITHYSFFSCQAMIKPTRKIRLRGKTAQGIVYATIDEDDYGRVLNCSLKWRLDPTGYVRGGHRNQFFLHRLIMNANKDETVDHINNDPLDNRKKNLRIVKKGEDTQAVNRYRTGGTSRFPGVSRQGTHGCFNMSITRKGKRLQNRSYTDEIMAARVHRYITQKLNPEIDFEVWKELGPDPIGMNWDKLLSVKAKEAIEAAEAKRSHA